MPSDVTPDQIVGVAVQLEEAGKEFYEQAAKITAETRSLFENLARAEERHAQLFSKMESRSRVSATGPAFEYLINLMKTGPIASLRESGKLAETPLNLDEAFDLATKFEKDTILFFGGLVDLLSVTAGETTQKIVSEEKRHLQAVIENRRKYQSRR